MTPAFSISSIQKAILSVRPPGIFAQTNMVPWESGTFHPAARNPPQFSNSMAFWNALVDHTGILCTPGPAFGPAGEGYVRFALVRPAEQLAAAARLIGSSGLLEHESDKE